MNMQIFELHFNPKIKDGYYFETFVHEPKNSFEKKMGGLYMAGEIKNAVPKKSPEFLMEISKRIQKAYYSSEAKDPEKSLLTSLKKANEYLSDEVKSENVSWLGNMNFSVISVKDTDLVFTISGDIKMLLIRNGEVVDIGKNLNLKEIEPYPLKVFLNTASGKILENDLVLTTTKEIYGFLKQEGVIKKLAERANIDSKQIKKIIPHSLFEKKEGAEIAGFLLILAFDGKKEKSAFSFDSFLQKKSVPGPKFPIAKLRLGGSVVEKLIGKKRIKIKVIILLILLFVFLVSGFIFFRSRPQRIIIQDSSEDNVEIFGMEHMKTFNSNIQKIAFFEGDILAYDPESQDPKTRNIFVPWKENGLEKFQADIFSIYLENTYFLNKETCKIEKVAKNDKMPQTWFSGNSSACKNPVSMAIDGSIWILNQDGATDRYYSGKFQETIILPVKRPVKIETNRETPYLFVSDPENRKLLVFEKKDGKILKEIQNDKLTDFKDFCISEDGKTVYILNGSNLYKAEI
ncbi:MAG: hypothetical protein Q8N69_01085 [bacterium]|nr:hypothetical protein [bacterium]